MASWAELFEVAKEWKKTFGEELGIGFDIMPDDVPMLRRCIAEKSKQPFEDHIERLLKTGAVY